MKVRIIFCLLFILINSKKEFKPKISLVNSLIRNDYDSNLQESICDAGTKEKCIEAVNPRVNEICCYIIFKENDKTYEQCETRLKDLDLPNEITHTKEYKAYLREQFGYVIYVIGQDFPEKIEENITCKNGEYNMVYENNYSEKEIKDLKDENHCLNIKYKKESDYKFDVGECKDYIILDSSRKDRLECGYFVYNITLKSKKTISYKTCNIFNLNMSSNIIKFSRINKGLEIENAVDSMKIDEEVESFTIEAYNSKGHKVKYDSKTDNTIVESSG